MIELADFEDPAEEVLETPEPPTTSPVVGVVLIVFLALVAVFGLGLVGGKTLPAQASTYEDYPSNFLSEVIAEDSPESPPGARYPHIVYRDGTLFVRGIASTEASVNTTVAELASLFGEGNVVAEILVDPEFAEDHSLATSVYFDENVLFDSGSSEIAPEFSAVFGASAAFLQISPETRIVITGHTDSNGDEDSNLELSQARVDAAREAMIAQGGDAARIEAIGEGEAVPIADNSTAEGRQRNRRVELTIETGE